MIKTHYFNPADDSDPDNASAPVGYIVLQPNNSLSWRALKFFLFTLLTISFCIALGFTLQGYWMILPFTILEMSCVGACLYYIARRANSQEVLHFSADEISLEQGRNQVERRICWPRYFSKFLVQPPTHPWYVERIYLSRAKEQIEIGRFLNQPEKKELLSQVHEMIQRADSAVRH